FYLSFVLIDLAVVANDERLLGWRNVRQAPVLDLRLPGINGPPVLGVVRRRQERHELVILFLGDRIELVIVTAGALQRQSQEAVANDVHRVVQHAIVNERDVAFRLVAFVARVAKESGGGQAVAHGGDASSRSTSCSKASGRLSARNASISSSVGGSPTRSRRARRSRVSRAASGANASRFASSLASRKASIGVRILTLLTISGMRGR